MRQITVGLFSAELNDTCGRCANSGWVMVATLERAHNYLTVVPCELNCAHSGRQVNAVVLNNLHLERTTKNYNGSIISVYK